MFVFFLANLFENSQMIFLTLGPSVVPLILVPVLIACVSTTEERSHRLAMSTFRRTFHHDGNFSPVMVREGKGCTCTPSPFYSIYPFDSTCVAPSTPTRVRPFRRKFFFAYKRNKANLDPFHMCFTISL